MGILRRFKANLHRMLSAIRLMRARGFSLGAALFLYAPVVFFLRAWRVIVRPVNKHWLNRLANYPRFMAFSGKISKSQKPRLFVIVMPATLHFLLPCIALLQQHSQVVLLINGARLWEQAFLKKRFPNLQTFALWTVPFTSITHSDVINLLIENHKENFGLVDHDCYVFDEALFSQLTLSPDEVLLAYFQEASQDIEMTFPHTHLLFFNVEPLRQLMQRYGVDASLYRQIPPTAQNALTSLGLGPGLFLKHYHNFYDTLHILLGVALAEGLHVRYLSSQDDLAAMHIGGTSIGIHHTKGLYELYIHLRFLEFLNDPILNKRYAFLTAPLVSSEGAFARRNPYDPSWRRLPVVDTLIQRLHENMETGKLAG